MSFKKALPFKKAVAFAGAASMLLGVSSLSAYEQDWSDKLLSNEEGNSWFKVNGEMWASYENSDKRSATTYGTAPATKAGNIDYSGFTLGRALLSVSGAGKKGEAEDWGYKIAYDAIINQTNVAIQNNAVGSAQPTNPYLNLAYFQVPIIKVTKIRVGLQHNPMVDGQAGTSLEKNWGHRFLDGDGKAMWEELGIVKSRDAGIGILHTNDLFNLHITLSNGEGYNAVAGANGQGLGLTTPWITADPALAGADAYAAAIKAGKTVAEATFAQNVAAAGTRTGVLSNLATGSQASYGLQLAGMLSLTPLKAQKDSGFDLSINFPFKLDNVYGMNRREYNDVAGVNWNTQSATAYMGDKNAKKDYTYGVEVDGKLVMSSNSSLSFGVGTVKMTDVRKDAVAVDGTLQSRSIENALSSGYYYAGTKTSGLAKYFFVTGEFGHIGFAARYSQGDGKGNGSEQLGVANKDGTTNGLLTLIEGLTSPNAATVTTTAQTAGYSALTLDRGLAKFQKTTLAVTVRVNQAFRLAVGVHDITNTANNGDNLKVDMIDTRNAAGSSSLGSVIINDPTASIDPSLKLAYGTYKVIQDKDLYGQKWRDHQVFARMQFLF